MEPVGQILGKGLTGGTAEGLPDQKGQGKQLRGEAWEQIQCGEVTVRPLVSSEPGTKIS